MSRLRANQITNENANGAPNFPHGLTVTGIITATNNQTTFSNIVVGSAVTANSQGIDVTGVATATSLKVGNSIIANSTGINVTGVITATSFSGIDSDKISEGNTEVETIDTGSDGHIKFTTEGTERLRILADGRIQPKYSSSAGATGGIMNVGAFHAKCNGNEAEGVLRARTDIAHTSVFDAAGWYDNTNFRYVPQVKGYYWFSVTVMFFNGMNGNSIESSLQLRLNGSTTNGYGYTNGYSTNYGNYDLNSFQGVIKCNGTTDYVDVNAYNNRSTNIGGVSNWSGFLLYPYV